MPSHGNDRQAIVELIGRTEAAYDAGDGAGRSTREVTPARRLVVRTLSQWVEHRCVSFQAPS
jgi:hypothetical protein